MDLKDPPAMKGYGFSPFWPAGIKDAPTQRVGVPGYPLYPQGWAVLLRWAGSSFQAVFTNPLFGFYVVLVAISFSVFAAVPYSAELESASVPPHFASALNAICTFLLTFFVGQNFSEANKRFENVCKTNGCVTRLSAIAGGLLPQGTALLLMRYTNAIMHIYYLMLPGPLDDAKWSALEKRGLLTQEEIGLLQLQGSPAVVLYSWALKALRAAPPGGGQPGAPERFFLELVQPLEELIGGARGLAAKQIAYTTNQVPSVYFHIVYFAVNMFLCCTTYEMGHAVGAAWDVTCDGTAQKGSVCAPKLVMAVMLQVLLIILFLGVLFTAEGMADIYGGRVFQYDLGVDLDNLWQESQNVLRSMAHEPSSLKGQPPPAAQPEEGPGARP
mmetsp:Transcript_41293/g.131317  ORF Transcript_41293/g.131317 Transcript_41293/m.131317 type:complete len:385 (+) Transcript_41293:82-1236(+)